MKLLMPGGLIQWWGNKVVFCDPEADTRLCPYGACNIAGVGESGFRVLAPCGPLILTIAGIQELDPASPNCASCISRNGDWELPETTTCTRWSKLFLNPIDLISQFMFVNFEFAICCDADTNEAVLSVQLNVVFCGTGVSIAKELKRESVIDGKCYVFDWGNPNEVFTCADPDTECWQANECEDTTCDFSGATFTITKA